MSDMLRRSDDLMNLNEYVPTVAETRLLEVMINPEFVGKSVVNKCKAAECTTPVYYAALKKPGFMALVRESAIDIVKSKVIDVVAATYRYATDNSQNHQDRKMLLEMSGLYSQKQTVNVSGNVELRASVMTEQEQLDLIRSVAERRYNIIPVQGCDVEIESEEKQPTGVLMRRGLYPGGT